MKYIKLSVFFYLILLISCNEIEVTDTEQTVVNDLFIQVMFEDEFQEADLSDISVSVSNPFNEIFNLLTDEQGRVNLPNALVGNYSIVASHSLSEGEVFALTGNAISGDLPFNGAISSFSLSSDNNLAEVELQSAGSIGNVIIRQVYYSGSSLDAAGLDDHFIELYNNSNSAVFIDRWYLGLTERRLRDTQDDRNDDGVVYTLPNGQFNWATSLDMGGAPNLGEALNTDFIYARDLYQFPGDGDDYRLEPGQSIVIAKDALNHKQGAIEPELTIDLSDADFEVYYNSNFDVDNSLIPNMTIIQERRPAGNNLILDAFGRNGFFLLNKDANVAAYPDFLRPDRDADFVGELRWYFKQIPVSDIVDGVEGNRFDVDRRVPEVFPASVDAGFLVNSGGLRSSEALIRKISPESQNNDRIVYVDTNNSTADFEVIFPEPGRE